MATQDIEIEIGKWMAGEITRDELLALVSAEELSGYEAILNEVDTWTVTPVNKEEGLNRLRALRDSEMPGTTKTRRLWPMVMAVAASLVLLAVAYFVVTSGGPIQHQTATGETQTVELPDGSKVTLNTASLLSWDEDTWEEARTVNLEGEAYFEVSIGSRFTVSLPGQQTVQVLGTRFLVRQRDTYLTVSCYEGRVGVATAGRTDSLDAGAVLRYDGDNVTLETTDLDQPSWVSTPEATSFTKAPLGEVLAALEVQFGIIIEADETLDLSRRYTGDFVNGNREVALQMVATPLQLTFEPDGKDAYRVRAAQ